MNNDITNSIHNLIIQSHQRDTSGLTNLTYTPNRSRVTTAKLTNSEHVCRSGSLKNFKMPTTEGVRRIFSREEVH